MIRKLLSNSKNINRDSFIWNMGGSMLLAFQSVIMLMILTRTISLAEAGVFTIANANANLFVNIGKYGMRNYQASDVNNQFSFKEYLMSRIITSIFMIIAAVVYVLIVASQNDYSNTKTWIIIWMCLFKVVDSIEDIYLGLYQQHGRLDIAGKMLTYRMIITIILFGAGIIVTKDLLLALAVSTIVTTIILSVFIFASYSCVKQSKISFSVKGVFDLLAKCFPLFLGAFLAFYIINAPKYAIDTYLNSEAQACYEFIAMPVFVIGLLNNFIFSPMIANMSVQWNDGDRKGFMKKFRFMLLIVFATTVICEAGAFVLGIPVLSLLYNTDLNDYKAELLILLLGGGFLALSGLLVTIITIIRYQNLLAVGYILVSVTAFFLCPLAVKEYEIMGAASLYVVLMVILCILFSGILAMGFAKKK